MCCLSRPFLHSEGISRGRNSHVRNLKTIHTHWHFKCLRAEILLSQTHQKWAEEGCKRNDYRLALPSCFSLRKRVTMPQCRGLLGTLDNLETNDNQNGDEQSFIILVYDLVWYFQNSVQTSTLLFPSEMTEVKPDPEHVEVLKRYFGHSKFRP